jgi:hypothetical protein
MRLRNKSHVDKAAEPEVLSEITGELWDRLLSDSVFRAKIDPRLAAAEAEGGATSHEEVFAELRKKYSL